MPLEWQRRRNRPRHRWGAVQPADIRGGLPALLTQLVIEVQHFEVETLRREQHDRVRNQV